MLLVWGPLVCPVEQDLDDGEPEELAEPDEEGDQECSQGSDSCQNSLFFYGFLPDLWFSRGILPDPRF